LARLGRGVLTALFLAVWALGALAGLAFGQLQRWGLNLADFAADAIDAVRG
jgi:hypothetical protein